MLLVVCVETSGTSGDAESLSRKDTHSKLLTLDIISVPNTLHTPPCLLTHQHTKPTGGGSVGSQQHFQAWLRATNSTSWTPRKSPAAATPPPAPAPSPAATPMSIMRDLQHSAATPPSTRHRAAPGGRSAAAAANSGFETSEGEEDEEEASTTIGAAQLAAAADRAAAANRMAVAGMRVHSTSSILQQQQQQQSARQPLQRHLSTPPRVPAPSPVVNSPAALGLHQQQDLLLQAAADRMVDSLATPMSHLSISRSRTAGAGQHSSTTPSGAAGAGATTPGELVMRSVSRAGPAAPPASPAEKLIGLMMSPGAAAAGADGQHRRHHHHNHSQQQQVATPSRLSAALGGVLPERAGPPLSPNLQVIDLMLQEAEGREGGAAGARAAVAAAGDSDVSGSASSVYGDDDDDDAAEEESADEMDLSELQALFGDGPDTPLSILGLLMGTPEVAGGLTPRLGATAAAGDQQQQGAAAGGEDIGPRVLFADD